jgi:hypothetical protein
MYLITQSQFNSVVRQENTRLAIQKTIDFDALITAKTLKVITSNRHPQIPRSTLVGTELYFTWVNIEATLFFPLQMTLP